MLSRKLRTRHNTRGSPAFFGNEDSDLENDFTSVLVDNVSTKPGAQLT
jgi:hypothetical protein